MSSIRYVPGCIMLFLKITTFFSDRSMTSSNTSFPTTEMFWRSQRLKWPRLPSLVPTCNRASHVCLHSWKFLFPQSFGVRRETVSHCPDKWHRTVIFHFPEARGSLAMVTLRTGRKSRMRGSSLNKGKSPRLELGIPSMVWLVVLSVGEPESWDVPMSYFLLSFALGSGIHFPSHVGGDTAAAAARVAAVRRETAVL